MSSILRLRREPASDADIDRDAEQHLAPLRRPGPAEKTLTLDLHRRGMLLRPRGLSLHRAEELARKVIRRTWRDRLNRQPQGKHHRKPLALPAPLPEATFSQHAAEALTAVAPRTYGCSDVLPATVAVVDLLLDGVWHEWEEGKHGIDGLLFLGADGMHALAHLGDRISRDENGVHVHCGHGEDPGTAYEGWETGEFEMAVFGTAGAA